MQATDILDLYKYEDAMNTALKTAIETLGITAVKQRDSDVNETPRARIQFAMGGDPFENFHTMPDGKKRGQAFRGNLLLDVITNRRNNDSDHSTIVATVRNLVHGCLNTINPLLNYHAIFRPALEGPTIPGIAQEENQDMSTLNFTLDFCIRTDAWPDNVS